MRLSVWVAISFAAIGGFFVWVSGAPARVLADREAQWGQSIEPGDLVFQDLQCGRRCALIREVTRSSYSHVGIVLEHEGERVVWEAYGPVGPVPLVEWARRGRDELIAIYRPRRSLALGDLRAALETMRGRPYDGDYLWDDERIYCSELVAKAYGELGDPFDPQPVSLGRFAAEVQRMSEGRLRDGTPMVTPADLIRSGRFTRIIDELAD